MPSKAHEDLGRRMNDIEQLLEAHSALTQFQRARKAAEKGGGELEKIVKVVDSLITKPGPGRRSEVGALNRAAMILLSAHLQGYVEDVYSESAKVLLKSNVKNIDALIKQGSSGFSNPHAYRIDRLFDSIGLPKITNGLSWQKTNNQSIKNRLTKYIEIRNEIAHGKQATVHKLKVTQFKQFVELFAENFDERLSNEIQTITGSRPW